MVPSTAFALHAGDTWVDCVLRAMGTLAVGLLMPSSVHSCVHAHLPQVQWARRRWATRSYTFKGRESVCCLGPAWKRRCGPQVGEDHRPPRGVVKGRGGRGLLLCTPALF